MESIYKEVTCKTAREFLEFLSPWSTDIMLEKYVFRGLSDERYKLTPSAFRDDEPGIFKYGLLSFNQNFKHYDAAIKVIREKGNLIVNQVDAEYLALRRFYKKANAHGLYVPKSKVLSHRMEKDFIHPQVVMRLFKCDEWMPKEIVEVAAIAQHYGIPTRLLDWTYNPFVAAFFASQKLKEYKSDDFICIYMININELSDILDRSNSMVKFYNPHYQWNDNALSQSGLFTYIEQNNIKELRTETSKLLTDISEGTLFNLDRHEHLITNRKKGMIEVIEEEVINYNKKRDDENKIKGDLIIKLRLPGSLSKEVNDLLRKINYTESTIFPGYNGVVSELTRYAKLKKNSIPFS